MRFAANGISTAEPAVPAGVVTEWNQEGRVRLFVCIAGVLIASVAGAAAARAGDLLAVSTSANDSLPIADAGFDWNGFYAGVYGVAQSSAANGGQFGLGLDLGVNARFEFVLVGAEVDFQAVTGGAAPTSYLQGLGKVGIALTDDLVAYGVGGAGVDLGPTSGTDALVGGGLDLAVTDDMSLNARYLHGIPLSGANPKDQVTIGANFHF